jgi:hypothetical protein
MAETAKRTHRIANSIGLLASGLALGWLVGLSVSPVLHVIVASILALAVAATSALAGLRPENDALRGSGGENKEDAPRFVPSGSYVSVLPLTLLTIGIAVGASAGVFVRTNNLLGLYPQISSKRWSGTGVEKRELEKRMFDAVYAPSGEIKSASVGDKVAIAEKSPEQAKGSSQVVAGLYATTAQQCDLLAGKNSVDLKTALLGLGDATTKVAMAKCSSDECLAVIREMLCPVH